MIIKHASVFQENETFLEKEIFIDGDFFTDCTEGDILDASGLYAIPGLIDLHFHGCDGVDFCDGTMEAFQKIADYEARNGITTINPATMTYDEKTLTKICQTAARFAARQDGHSEAELIGINMEGPFISLEKKGAQNPAFIHAPDIDLFRRLQTAANGMIRLVDLAPETEHAMSFIHTLRDDVRISLAHTTADYDTAKAAFDAGACHVTHLYNAMPPFSHRSPGLIGAASDDPKVMAELICDGVHVHPSAVRAAFRLFGKDHIILISDSMMATGLDDGGYSLGGQAVTVKGNRATLADGTIAGSATNLMNCLRTVVKEMGIPLSTAIQCATANPAKALGIYDHYGSIASGKYANLLLLDEDLNLVHVFLKGHQLF